MRTWTKALGVATLCGALGVSRVDAQASGSIQALANVLAPITVAAGQNLDFGNVTPGVNKTVAVTDATSGRFDATGQASARPSPPSARVGPRVSSWAGNPTAAARRRCWPLPSRDWSTGSCCSRIHSTRPRGPRHRAWTTSRR